MAGLGFDYVLLSVAPTIWWLVLCRIVAGMFGWSVSEVGASLAVVGLLAAVD